jgi:hypothetical protein
MPSAMPALAANSRASGSVRICCCHGRRFQAKQHCFFIIVVYLGVSIVFRSANCLVGQRGGNSG